MMDNARVITAMIIPIRNSFIPIVPVGVVQRLAALIAQRKTIPYKVGSPWGQPHAGDLPPGGMVMKLLKDRRGYSLTFWTIFFGFILIPMLALSIELGRYFYARAEVAKAADATALAAAEEISQRVFEETGDLQPIIRTWANAQAFASMNNSYLAQYRVNVVVTEITVDVVEDTVLVQVWANLDQLFPAFVPLIMVTEIGLAEVRPFSQ